MKKIVFLAFLVLISNLFSQETTSKKSRSKFIIGILGGVAISDVVNPSVTVEGKMKLGNNLNARLSVGYYRLTDKSVFTVKTNGLNYIDDTYEYVAISYQVDRIEYDVFPISLGAEYFLFRKTFSPYITAEAGYMNFSNDVKKSNKISGVDGKTYNTYSALPDEYKNDGLLINDNDGVVFSFGAGTNIRLSSALNLDLRYLFQLNNTIMNSNRIMLGVAF